MPSVGRARMRGTRRSRVFGNRPGTYQLNMLNSAFRLLAACYLATKSYPKSDGLRIRGQNAGFQRSNRQPLLGILRFWVAWMIFTPQMRKNRTARAYGMVTELTVGN